MRRLGVEDWETLRAVRLDALRESPEAFYRSYADALEIDADGWRRLFTPDVAHFVVETTDRPVGLVIGVSPRPGQPDPEAVELGAMWVAPQVRGDGVADLLVDAVIGWARGGGHSRVVLWVYDANLRAVTFYRRRGFVQTGTQAVDTGKGTRRMMTTDV